MDVNVDPRVPGTISRRRILQLGSGLAASFALAACDGTGAPNAQATGSDKIPKQFIFSTYGDVRFYKQGFESMKTAVSKYNSVSFVSAQSTSASAIAAKLLTGYVAQAWDTLPDVCEIQWSDIARLTQAGVLVDLTDRFKPYEQQVARAVLEPVQVNGKTMACPWRPNTFLFWYNKALFDQAGIDVAQIKTYDDYLAAGKKLADFKFPDGQKRAMCHVEPTPVFNTAFLTQQGATLFQPGTQKLLDFRQDDKFKQAFEFQVAQARSGISLSVTSYTATWYQALSKGLIASVLSPNWIDQSLEENVKDGSGKWRVGEPPAFTAGGGTKALYGVATVGAINKPDLNHDLAWQFMQNSFYSQTISPKLYSDWFLEPCWYPIEDKTRYSTSLPFYGGQNPGAIDKAVQEGAHQEVGSPNYAQMTDILSNQMSRAQSGKASVADAINAAFDTAHQQGIPTV
jgi:ABC-type glycerol-3-phosphate transport system substrate-binding protein